MTDRTVNDPPARPWFRLALADRAAMERDDVKEWLQDVTDIMREYFATKAMQAAITDWRDATVMDLSPSVDAAREAGK